MDFKPTRPTGDIIFDAVVAARSLADQRVLNGLTGRQVSSVSDLHIAKGEPITVRINGELETLPQGDGPEAEAVTEQQVVAFLREKLNLDLGENDRETGRLHPVSAPRGLGARGANTWTLDTEETGRLRVHVTNTDNGYAVAIRLLPSEPPNLAALGLPPFIGNLTKRQRGLTIVAGGTNTGKSTLLAAILEIINQTRGRVIYTYDDYIEYRFTPNKSRFRQVEVGAPGHAPTYGDALSETLVGDPDIVVISEARDPAALDAAIQIAERGKWCILTTHLERATQVADRIVGAFPPDSQDRIRTSLAATLQDVIVMSLPRTEDGSRRVAACEILTRTEGMTQAILKPHEVSTDAALKNIIQSGKNDGMQLMEDALQALVAKQIISREEALEKALRPEEMRERLGDRARTEPPKAELGGFGRL